MNKRATTQLIIPEASGWSLLPYVDGQRGAPQPIDSPTAVATSVPTDLAIPACHAAAVPLWLQAEDESLFEEMIRLQLERRGLLTGSVDLPIAWKTISKQTGRTLVLALTLITPVPDEISLRNAQRFEPSPAFFKIQDGQVFLYRELDRIVASYFRDGRLCWFQTLGSTEPGSELNTELHCLVLQLGAEGVMDPFLGIVESIGMPEEARLQLSTLTGVPVTAVNRPTPELPESTWDLIPPSVAAHRIHRKTAGARKRILAICAVAYVLFVAAFIAKAGVQYAKIVRLRKEVHLTAPGIADAKATAQRWRALEPAIDPALYPVEQLYRAAQLLPPDGVRFTIVEQRGTSIQIRGEAKNAPAAFKLFEDLKGNVHWPGYTWEMPNPRLLPNGSAQFLIEGTRGHAGTQS